MVLEQILLAQQTAPEPLKAEVVTAIMIIVAITSLIASMMMMKKGSFDQSSEFDESISNFADRNSPIPIIIGRRKVGANVLSVWGRYVKKETVSGGGGKGGSPGPPSTSQVLYYENAVHAICVGPMTKLFTIYENGEEIFTGEVIGTGQGIFEGDLGGDGKFTINFGLPAQTQARGIHYKVTSGEQLIESSGAFLATIKWEDKRLGQSPNWRQIEYEVECFNEANVLPGSVYTLFEGPRYGVNGASVIYQLLTAPFPLGIGMPPEYIDAASLLVVATLCETELLYFNLLIKGDTAKVVLTDVLNNLDVTMTQVGSHLVFNAVRNESGVVPILTGDVLKTPEEEIRINLGLDSPTRMMFSYPERYNKYRADGNPVDDDGAGERFNNFKPVSLRSNSITDRPVADRVRMRKMQTVFGDKQSIRVDVLRGASLLVPGKAVEIEGVGRVRVISVKRKTLSNTATIEVIMDSYGVPAVDGSTDDPGVGSPEPVAPDIAFNWFELPASEVQDTITLGVVRLRAHRMIHTAALWGQNAGDAYFNFGEQTGVAFGGKITENYSIGTEDEVDLGPIFEAANNDLGVVLDLTGDDSSWQGGAQLASINGELMFVRAIRAVPEDTWASLTAYILGDKIVPPGSQWTGLRYECTTAGTTGNTNPSFTTQIGDTIEDGSVVWTAKGLLWQARGVLRARHYSVQENHVVDDYFFIIPSSSVVPNTPPNPQLGQSYCVKTQPSTISETEDLVNVTAVCKTIVGHGLSYDTLVDESANRIVTSSGVGIKLT